MTMAERPFDGLSRKWFGARRSDSLVAKSAQPTNNWRTP
jgi:hypothetical protein